LRENSDDEEQIAAFLRFEEVVRRTPGLLAIWIGPQVPVRRVNPRLTKVLQSDLEIYPPPLSASETAQLLRAAKLGRAYDIDVHPRVAREVHRLMRGNPYWITELAAILYDPAKPRPDGSIRFTQEMIEPAKQKMVDRERVFADRLYSPHDGTTDPARPLKEKILQHLLRSGPEGVQADAFVAPLEVRATDQRHQLNEALEDLRLGGTLAVDERFRYTIQAPILVDYIRFSLGIRVKES
ncbi:MAG TPA: hypothetical protein VFO89_06540, partial [Thermoanaerobaculia bacterium]|nr:hypothetical protein [Thermoanaerobaculia bacterium]